MPWTSRFDPAGGVIWIRAHVTGPSGERYLPDNVGVEGLIGMDLIAGRILTIDAQRGTVSLSP